LIITNLAEITVQLNSKSIAAIIVFTALTLALNLSPIKIPAPYAPFLIYQIWEIPIVAAFVLYGPKVGVPVAIINTLVLLIIFPGALPTGPFYNLAAVLSMLIGIYIVQRVAFAFSSPNNEYVIDATAYLIFAMLSVIAAFIQSVWWLFPGIVFSLLLLTVIGENWRKKTVVSPTIPLSLRGRSEALLVTTCTVAGTLTRVVAMIIVNGVFLPFPPPVGFAFPREAVIAIMPLVGLFNATLALYTIPIGYSIARVVRPGLKSTR
jgi:riboflavin transporter FmnP